MPKIQLCSQFCSQLWHPVATCQMEWIPNRNNVPHGKKLSLLPLIVLLMWNKNQESWKFFVWPRFLNEHTTERFTKLVEIFFAHPLSHAEKENYKHFPTKYPIKTGKCRKRGAWQLHNGYPGIKVLQSCLRVPAVICTSHWTSAWVSPTKRPLFPSWVPPMWPSTKKFKARINMQSCYERSNKKANVEHWKIEQMSLVLGLCFQHRLLKRVSNLSWESAAWLIAKWSAFLALAIPPNRLRCWVWTHLILPAPILPHHVPNQISTAKRSLQFFVPRLTDRRIVVQRHKWQNMGR